MQSDRRLLAAVLAIVGLLIALALLSRSNQGTPHEASPGGQAPEATHREIPGVASGPRLRGTQGARDEAEEFHRPESPPNVRLGGRVLDSTGIAARHAKVAIHRLRKPRALDVAGLLLAELPYEVEPIANSACAVDGAFQVAALPTGTWVLIADAPGYARTVVTVEAREDLRDMHLPIEAEQVIEGQVLDPTDDLPVSGAFVGAAERDPRTGRYPTAAFDVTDRYGRFRLSGLRAGCDPWIVASREGYGSSSGPYAASYVASGDVSVLMGRGEPVDVEVTDAESAGPLAGALVMLHRHENDTHYPWKTSVVVSDSAGRARLWVPRGKYWTLGVTAEGHALRRWKPTSDCDSEVPRTVMIGLDPAPDAPSPQDPGR